MRSIDRREQRAALVALFAVARENGTVLNARRLVPAKRFGQRMPIGWLVSTNETPPSTSESGRYISEEELRNGFAVPQAVIDAGQGLVGVLGRSVEAMKLDAQLVLCTSAGAQIGEAGEYVLYEPAGDLFFLESADSWVDNYCPQN
jgi:hypothetical protein